MPNEIMFFQTLQQNINVSIESNLLNIYPKLNGISIKKIKMPLSVIIKSVPFEPKISDHITEAALAAEIDSHFKQDLNKNCIKGYAIKTMKIRYFHCILLVIVTPK